MRISNVIIFAIAIGFVSCSDQGTSMEDSRMELLTSHLWRFEYYIVDGQEVTYAGIKVVYTRGGMYSWLSEYGDPRTGTWEFANNANTIIFDKGTRGVTSGNILELSRTRFSIKGTTFGPSDGTVPFEAVLLPITQ